MIFKKSSAALLLSLFLSGAVFFFLFPCFSYAGTRTASPSESQYEPEKELSLYADAAVLMDADSGRILYEKNAKKILPMASTTKVMTCILALEYGNLKDYAAVSSYACSMPKVKLYARQGEYFLLEDLLYSLMLESHNDSAVIIAEHIAGSTEAFADMMNQKARDIGCFDTFFITPNGLDATATDADGNTRIHSTTAADLARILSYCITRSPKKEEFLSITRTDSYSFTNYQKKENGYLPGGRTFSCTNHNAFLSMMEGALCGKTGFTANAGYCYTGALKRDERTFVVALLACGWPGNKSYKWSDTRQLMDYGLENFELCSLSRVLYDEASLPSIPVKNGQTDLINGQAFAKVAIDRSAPEENGRSDTVLLKKDEQFQVDFQMEKELTAPVQKGTEVGKIRYLAGNEVYRVEYIFTTNEVKAVDYPYCFIQILSRYLALS